MPKKAMLGPLSDMDIRLLKVFRTITDSGGLSAAELALNIGRSTISRHLRDLEMRLGVTLCRRGRAGFELTPEGHIVYDATLRLLGAFDEFRGSVNDVHEKMRGHINIALHDKTITNKESRMHEAIRRFDDAAPEVTIDVHIEPLNEIERGIIDGRFHLGVVPMHRVSSTLDYYSLFEEPMHLYCGRHHPFFSSSNLPNDKILSAKFAGLGYHSPNMMIGDQLNMRRIATGYDQEAIALLILSGKYIAYLPDHYAGQFVDRGEMARIQSDVFRYTCDFSAIVRNSPKPSLVLQHFLDEVVLCHQSK